MQKVRPLMGEIVGIMERIQRTINAFNKESGCGVEGKTGAIVEYCSNQNSYVANCVNNGTVNANGEHSNHPMLRFMLGKR